MGRKYIFSDESGNFDFSTKPGASKYFILTTLTMLDCSVGDALLSLRREMAWKGTGLDGTGFHASEATQAQRDEIFSVITTHDFRIDATLLHKCKAQPHLAASEQLFYQTAWYNHLKYVAPLIASPGDELLVVGSSLGTKARRKLFHAALQDVVKQVSPTLNYRAAFWDTASEPCLLAADYCSWALQRKWERGDTRSYDLVASQVKSEFDLWRYGTATYY
jgi:hypothetical protein